MSNDTAIIAAMMKEAERLKNRILDEVLPRARLEDWNFTDEDIDNAWNIIDRILAIGQKVSVRMSTARAIERVELAETINNRREEMALMGLHYDDQVKYRSLLEDY